VQKRKGVCASGRLEFRELLIHHKREEEEEETGLEIAICERQ
tara:strand:+ start:225 stop:350 length:126 start_codon:yes stop_codon:yes gene_type:complete